MLSYNSARKLIKEVEFPGDSDPTYLIALSGKSYRKEALRIQVNDQDKIAAAIEIQRAWRGHCTRRKLVNILNQNDFSINPREAEYPHVCSKYLEYVEWCHEQGLDSNSTAILTLEDYSARIIQSWWRGILQTWALMQKNISSGGRRVMRKSDMHRAARIIQRTWRRHNDMKVFQFYRDLIDFKGRGKPYFMLKTINPKEAKLLDKAAGAHVRFRLGGIKFPPNIYYKIYTRRHIVDLCASSPRDYTSMTERKLLPQQRHNKDSRNLAFNNKVNWYQRHENNGWRLVSDRLFLGPLQDDVTIETSNQRQTFHHCKIQRRKDMEKIHKRKKIEWLRKMYREGMLKAKEELDDTSKSEVDLAAEEIMSLVDNPPTEEIEAELDGDIDRLLSWTNGLNFEEYITEWHLSASSAFSDENHDVFPSEEDKYEVTFKVKQKAPE